MRRSRPLTISLWIVCAVVALVAVLVLVAGSAVAQDGGYEISWFSIHPGGGQSVGGGYALVGTAGQPEAGTLSGGPYTLAGGFVPPMQPLNYHYLPVIMR